MRYYLEMVCRDDDDLSSTDLDSGGRSIIKVPLVIERTFDRKEEVNDMLNGSEIKDLLGYRMKLKIFFFPSTFNSLQQPYNNAVSYKTFFENFFISKHIWVRAANGIIQNEDEFYLLDDSKSMRYMDGSETSRYLCKSNFADSGIDMNVDNILENGLELTSEKIFTTLQSPA